MRLFGVDISDSSSATAAADQSLLVWGSTTRFFGADISTSASASSAAAVEPSLLVGEYEVFLSFCGQDTRHSFTDYLYTSHHDTGIRTFSDTENLRVQEEIGSALLKGITNSKISIPVLSKNYASSKWCLHGLEHIAKCHKNGGQVIFPVFYDIVPSDVRHYRVSYKAAFDQDKKDGHSKKGIQEWKHGVKTVGRLKGLKLEKESGRHESELAKIITNKVLDFLKKNNNKHADLALVRMCGCIGRMKELLNIHCDNVHSIEINRIKITCTRNLSCIINKNSLKENL